MVPPQKGKRAHLQIVIAVRCVCRDQGKGPRTLMPCERIHAIRSIELRPYSRTMSLSMDVPQPLAEISNLGESGRFDS